MSLSVSDREEIREFIKHCREHSPDKDTFIVEGGVGKLPDGRFQAAAFAPCGSKLVGPIAITREEAEMACAQMVVHIQEVLAESAATVINIPLDGSTLVN